MFGLKPNIYLALFSITVFGGQSFAGQLSPSTEVQANITLLTETKSCPKCNLSGADLNRLDLAGANLEGANLSWARMSLSNLSGANLHNADLREAVFNGADLANTDLRGADLTGASLIGAYMEGTLMDGELIATTPYDHDGMGDVEETVYVEDTVNPKMPQGTKELIIGSRRDFEETPPPVPNHEAPVVEIAKSTQPMSPGGNIPVASDKESLPQQSAAAPASKTAPTLQEVRIEEEAIGDVVLLTDANKKQPSPETTVEQAGHKEDSEAVDKSIDDAFAEKRSTLVDGDMPQQVIPAETLGHKEKIAVEKVDEGRQPISDETPSPVADSDLVEGSLAGQETSVKGAVNEDTPEGIDAALVAETGVDGHDIVDQTHGMIQSMLNVFSSEEPSTEGMKNVAVLLDVNKCYGCNLVGVDLSGENLEDADLEEADLTGANLKGADLEGANMKGANLTGADLSGADLSKADMYKAILTDADLTDADLEDTLLDDAQLSGVKGYKKQSIMLMKQE